MKYTYPSLPGKSMSAEIQSDISGIKVREHSDDLKNTKSGKDNIKLSKICTCAICALIFIALAANLLKKNK
jgi:hypothetical protein